MVAFARAKAKSMFSKLRFTSISKKQIATQVKAKNKNINMQKKVAHIIF
tara:strand:+ start:168 stop:314 length:147 start_codon:yes stop_codon:yes gene_type:complete